MCKGKQQMKFWTLIPAALIFGASTYVNAASVSLISGDADPLNIGAVPVPENSPQAFSGADISSMTDGDLSTGFVFSSSLGEYSSNPAQVIGFKLRFDFDVSAYRDISEISFTWTGKYYWDGNTFNEAYFGNDVQTPTTTRVYFGPDSRTPDGQVRTVTINYSVDGIFNHTVADVQNGNIASFWVYPGLGISCDYCVNSITMETLEVSANLVGSPVPLPAAAWLFGSGLIALVGFAKRKKV